VLDLAVVGGSAVTSEGVGSIDIGISAGRISVVAASGALPAARQTIDASRCYVLPGLVDPHTHPGNVRSLLTDVASETRSAAIGGITTMLGTVKSTRMVDDGSDRPPSDDPGSYVDSFPEVRAGINSSAHVDVGLSFVMMTRLHVDQIGECVREFGVTSFKFHLTFPSRTAWGAKIGIPTFPDDGTIFAGFRACAVHGALAMVHPENHQIVQSVGSDLASGATGLSAAEARFPGYLEASEIGKAARLARITGAQCYAAHVSSREGLAEVARARLEKTQISAETCPQYLVLNADDVTGSGDLLRFNPPLRRRADNDALWGALQDGLIDAVGSDHVPNLRALKIPDDPGEPVMPGSPGVATMLPLLWTYGVRAGRITPERLAEVAAATPARLFNLYPRKGIIRPGSDADLVIVDPEEKRIVDPRTLASWADYSAYEGLGLYGWPKVTILRGRVIAQDGQPVGQPQGQYLHRPLE